MDSGLLLIALGVLFLAGLAADQLGHLARLPRVTMLLLLGVAVGRSGLDLVPPDLAAWFDLVSIIALTMVAFVLGSTLTRDVLAARGRTILCLSVVLVLTTIAVSAAGLAAAGLDLGLALVLGSIATATAPAAVTDVIDEVGLDNRFTDTLKGVVAIDDAWGVIAFSIALAVVNVHDGWGEVLTQLGRDLGGALVLGVAVGIPAAYLTGRLDPGKPLQTEAIGLVLLTAGAALWLEVSFLVAGMTAGCVIANTARHHERAFHEIEHIRWPFLLLFFLLAGASLELDALVSLGWIGVLYIVLRIVARLVGGWVGARLGGAPASEVPWYGPALLPQAGVAVGMALVAAERLSEWASTILALTIASTVVFELIGPPATALAVRRSAESGRQPF